MKVDLQHVIDTSHLLKEYFNFDNVAVVLTGPYTKTKAGVGKKMQY